jgi:hypothetical protein
MRRLATQARALREKVEEEDAAGDAARAFLERERGRR